MQCCIQGRARLKHSPTQIASGSAAPSNGAGSSVAVSSGGTVLLHYKDDSPIVVRGPQSGRDYRFSASQSQQAIDRRDADALLGTGLFRRIV